MRSLRNLLLIALVAAPVTSARQNPPARQDSAPKFSMAISTPQQEIKVGSKLVLDVSWTNRSGKKVATGMPGAINPIYIYKIIVLDEGGKMPPRTSEGRNVVDHDPGIILGNAPIGPVESVPHIDLEDGESVREHITITDLFNLSAGKYTIQFERGDKTVVKSNVLAITVAP